jgi:tRNA modification GTPase
MGIERTTEALHKARIILWLTDDEQTSFEEDLIGYTPTAEQQIYRVITKCDIARSADCVSTSTIYPTLRLSARTGEGMDDLLTTLQSSADATDAYRGEVIVSNHRHHEALCQAGEALTAALEALHNGIPTDLMSEDIRLAIHHLGTITGEITSEDILTNIFSHFCIGK